MSRHKRQMCKPSVMASAVLAASAALLFGSGWADEAANNQESFGAADVVALEYLADERGGSFDTITTVTTIQNQTATINGGSIHAGSDINTGAVSVGDLGNFNGIGLIVSNTGNGSAVNAALGVNININN